MDLTTTRQSLHALAELVLAGPQYRMHGTIRLRIVPGGFGTTAAAFDVRVDGVRVVRAPHGVQIDGVTPAQIAQQLGIEPSDLRDLYQDATSLTVADTLSVEPGAAAVLHAALGAGDRALRTFDPHSSPVLWPEHFDVAITLDGVNYGVSPGDGFCPEPYAYVGPPQIPEGPTWNAPFGAYRPLDDRPDPAAIAAFFGQGRDALADAAR